MPIRIGNFNAYKLHISARGNTDWDDRVRTVRTVQEFAHNLPGLQEVVIDEVVTPCDQWDTLTAQTSTAIAQDCGLTAAVPSTPGRPHGVAMAANSHRAAPGTRRKGQLPPARCPGLLARPDHGCL